MADSPTDGNTIIQKYMYSTVDFPPMDFVESQYSPPPLAG